MNQIQESDWAEESWHSHTGMDSANDYCVVDKSADQTEAPSKSDDRIPTTQGNPISPQERRRS